MMNSRAAACSCVRSGSGSAIREIKPLNGPTSLHGIWQPSNWAKKFQRPTYWVKLIRGMGASANTVIYASQQEADDECERLARLFLQCTPRERKLIAAIIDTILDQHRQEDTPDEKA